MIEPLQHCFVIMSFSGHEQVELIYRNAIFPTVTNLGFECCRVDKVPSLSSITAEIELRIRNAYFVIADLTEKRHNCFYELGYAHGLKKAVVLIARRGTRPPFDVSHYPFIFYDSETDLKKCLGARIRQVVLRSVARDPEHDPRNGGFGRSAVANGRILMARVLRTYIDDYDGALCDIRIAVSPLPGKPPLTGSVKFYVHPSYTKTYYRSAVENGCAALELEAVAGAFTVSAVADGHRTRLELDLATLPSAPDSFYPSTSLDS